MLTRAARSNDMHAYGTSRKAEDFCNDTITLHPPAINYSEIENCAWSRLIGRNDIVFRAEPFNLLLNTPSSPLLFSSLLQANTDIRILLDNLPESFSNLFPPRHGRLL